MKKSILASLVLLCAAVHLPAYANTNGVYFQVEDAFYETGEERLHWYIGKPAEVHRITAEEVAYACNGKSFTVLPGGAGLKYCSRDVEVKLVWKRVITYGYGPGTDKRTGDPEWIEVVYSMDDSDAAHCGFGEAVVWDVWVTGIGGSNSGTSQREFCRYCAYTGGPCE